MRANQAQQDQAVGIRYVGVRDLHEDHLYGTRLAWLPGQVHNVDATVAARMLMHKDVYERADAVADRPVAGKANQVEQEQNRIQEQQLQRQSLLVNGENLLASLHEMNVEPDTVLAALPSGITAMIREEQLADLQDEQVLLILQI